MDSRKYTCENGQVPRPATGKTPVRNLRVRPEVWEPALERAKAEGTSLTAVIIAFLERYNAGAGNDGPPPVLQLRVWEDTDDGSYSWKPKWSEWEDVDPEYCSVGDHRIEVRVKPQEAPDA
jgi:hypothetical protein